MRVKDKNRALGEFIRELGSSKDPLRRSVARALNRPRRSRFEVNLHRIEAYAKPKEYVLIPGIVLGTGEITKPVTVAALRFSRIAKDKIEKSGGKCLSIKELLEAKTENIRIMG
jgi:large subunit ribosomal protein L18e